MITIDGSHMEGGGSIVRVALALSTLTGQEFKVINIRANREVSGLKAQHLESIKALKEICNAETNEINIGTKELWYKPGRIKGGKYKIDIGTAGSISLLLQAIILPSLFAPKKVSLEIKGGTCGKWQASVDYLQNVLISQLKRFVEKIELKIIKRGYYPKGGGEVILEISPKYSYPFEQNLIQKIELTEQGRLEQIKGVVNISAELAEKEVAERIQKAAVKRLEKLNAPISIRQEYSHSLCVGGEIVLWTVFSKNDDVSLVNQTILGSSRVIDKSETSEQIGQKAAEDLIEEINSGKAVDHYLADQLIPFMGLLPGSEISCSKISKHTESNIYVTELFLPVKFEIDKKENLISVKTRRK